MWAMVFFMVACVGWIAFFIAEAAYDDLRKERDRYRGRARKAEAELNLHKSGLLA
ncbi:MAG: hypothetical protein ACXVGQ_00200 [Mycobacteriaceae bacterium]